VLRTEAAALDAGFDEWMRQKFATQLGAVDAGPPGIASAMRGGSAVGGRFVDALRAARRHLDAGDHERALQEAERARLLFPQYTGADNAYRIMHEAHTARGDSRRAMEALRLLVDRNETDYDAHLSLADALEAEGRKADAVAILERAMFISPYDPQVHVRMAALYGELGDHRKAVRERRAVLALDPVNRADALYRLALALYDAGERDDARRQVLRALEIAPNFTAAQELLLRIRGGGQ
jgi:cellulose synthase operon protein C